MTEPVLKYAITRSLYEASVTRKGHPCFIVSYYSDSGEVFKEWLFGGGSISQWWDERSAHPAPSTMEDAADLASRGAVLPTKTAYIKREGRWPTVVRTEVGEFPDAFGKFMKEAREVFGEVEIIKVVS